jgi:hypothetical protein
MLVSRGATSREGGVLLSWVVRTLGSWQLLVAGVGGSAALCGCEARVSRLLSGVDQLGRLLMSQSTPSRSMPLPLWVTVGFYPFYLIFWLGMCFWTPKSEGFFKIWPYVLMMGFLAIVVFRLLTEKPFGRLIAIIMGGVALPAVGVLLLVVHGNYGVQADDPPAWFVVLFCLGFFLGGIWHWWALTRPAVRQWFTSSEAKALPAKEERPQSGGEKGDIVH